MLQRHIAPVSRLLNPPSAEPSLSSLRGLLDK